MSNYYDYYKNEHKVPGIIAIILVLTILAVPLFFLRQKTQPTKSLGFSNDRSISVNVLNRTATSVDLYWRTEEESVDVVTVWDKSGKTSLVTDINDIDSNKEKRHLHFFSLRNLIANTEYFISIQHKDKILGSSSNPYFSFTTLSSSAITTSLPPVYGKLVDETGKPQPNTLLIATIKNASVLGGFTKADGSFLISLCCLYNKGTNEPLNPSRDEVITINFEHENGKKAKIGAPISKTSPFQEPLVIGRDVELTNDTLEEKPILGESISTTSPDVGLVIYYPKDSAVVPGRRPLVKGTSKPKSTVKISFPLEKRSFQVIANNEGDFELSTPFNLTGGPQTVVAQSTNEKGKLISVSRSFTIPKSGEAVLGEATPSGSLTPTTGTVEPTIAPTITLEPTDTIVQESPTVTKTPTPTLLPTGIDFGLFSMMSAMLILFGVGILLIF